MQWYDAFSGEPLLVDESVTETKVQAFCNKLRISYAPSRAPNEASTKTKQADKS